MVLPGSAWQHIDTAVTLSRMEWIQFFSSFVEGWVTGVNKKGFDRIPLRMNDIKNRCQLFLQLQLSYQAQPDSIN